MVTGATGGREERGRRTSINGVELHWIECGGGEAPATPIVLLHGLCDSHRTWTDVAGALAEQRLVLALDLPGHGLSSRPNASYALGWHARIVSQWLASTGHRVVDVVGHSFGGGVAQMLLLECHVCVRRLVLVASGGLGREVSAALRLASLPRVVERLGQPFMGIATRLALRGQRGFARNDIEELAAMNVRCGTARAFARTVRDVIDWRGQRRFFLERAGELPELPPIAVLWGDRDPVIPVAHGARFADAVDGVCLIRFDGCGHYLHRERPAAFVRTVRAFLDAPELPRAAVRMAGATAA
jgi:pimeloyl-ACP methyl ester carboxylesterase